MSPQSKGLFAAAEAGHWRGVFDALAAMHKGFREGESSRSTSWAVYPVEWAVVNEIGAALEQFAAGEEKYAIAFVADIISSIPPGSIYFAGTDPGRYLVTGLSRSHVNANPFFTVTQNALADSRSYLRYLRGMYGSRIYIPTEEDVTRSINSYKEDARRRQSQGRLMPGEMIEDVGDEGELRGQLSVMAINGLLSQLMFDRNPDREFYVEEGFPLNWMYPHLAPNKLILKIHRQSLSEIPRDLVLQDHDYWTHYIRPMIGTWLNDLTSVGEIVAFVEKVYVKKDLEGFTGDPAYVRNELTQGMFSKLRSSIGSVYAWRAQQCENSAEKEHMLTEADFAFRQAFALCPASPEAVFRYINLLVGEKRLPDATLVAEMAVRVEQLTSPTPESPASIQEESQTAPPKLLTPLGNLLEQLKRMQQDERK
ncbi:MAG: hypothetical protein L0Z50_12325 [Verrucomicrobiales bacterium]|nr:hypothetical protein [Verrucomicrobiales bacterium]